MAAQLAAYQREMAVERERQASTSANYRAALLSSLSIAQELSGLKLQLRNLEDGLAEALSVKGSKESKYQPAKETISSTAAINEKLEGMATDQRDKRDHHAAVISNHLEAIEALEAKFIEDETRMKKIEEAVIWYSKFLGFQVIGGEGVKFIFNKIDLQSPDKEYSVTLKLAKDGYNLLQCDPSIKDSGELMKDLNLTNDLFKFVRIVRQRFQAEAATVNGILPMSSVVCPDASSIPVSPPVLMPLDSRTENVPDKSLSQSKNKGQNLPSKRRAAVLSAASPGAAGIRRHLQNRHQPAQSIHRLVDCSLAIPSRRRRRLGTPAPPPPPPPTSEMRKTKPSKQSRAQAQQNGGAGHSKLARYFDPEASWDKVLGLACGLLWGAVPLVGAIWIALFVTLSTGLVYWYYAYLLKIDEEEFGGHGALLQEGMFASFTLFLLSWTLVYSLVHF
uniref:Kinetochore protein SPC25 n=1 Tax=Oryza punctata TaxID=4537 RepID=A0A0E0KXN2_ORYPU